MKLLDNVIEKLNTKEISKSISELEEKSQEFLETKLGQVVNTGIDFGIKAVLPDWLEGEIIEIKDSVLNDGFKEGVQMAVNKALDLGKALEGIFTGNFESISQIKTVIKSGGLLDTVSKLLDNVITWAKDEKIINNATAKMIKSSKKAIMENVENSIDNSLEDQVTAIEKINGYIEKWKAYFENEDFINMKKIYNKIEKQVEQIMPIQSTLEKIEYVENLQNLIENNGKNFNLSEEELELANMLV